MKKRNFYGAEKELEKVVPVSEKPPEWRRKQKMISVRKVFILFRRKT